jgi:hypothetical protein
MTFEKFLHATSPINGPAGDLAYDMLHDKSRPEFKSASEVREYLVSCGACSGALEVVDEFWELWEMLR